jgi:SAM-dependent methyltransferase
MHGWQLEGSSSDAYDEFLVPAIFEPWAEVLLDTVDPKPGERVLDLACGTGAAARAAAGRVLPQGTVTGTDVNPAMLATARRLDQDDHLIEWHEADAVALPFQAETFDVVVCQQAFQFIAGREDAAREMQRVLTPAGRAVVGVWRGLEHNRAFALFADVLERHAPAAGEIMRSPFRLGEGLALRELLTSAGFGHVRVVVEAKVSRFPSPAELLRQEALSSPLAEPLGQLDRTALDALVDDVAAVLAGYVDDDGLAMPMESHIALAS